MNIVSVRGAGGDMIPGERVDCSVHGPGNRAATMIVGDFFGLA